MSCPITDPVSGVWSSAQIIDHLTRECARAAEQNLAVGVGLVDIDDFAEVTRGLTSVDRYRLLGEAAERMRSAIRKTDAIGRYAGEEFLIVLDPTSRGQMTSIDPAIVMERVRHAIAAGPFHAAQGTIGMTVSIGVATSALDAEPCAVIATAVQALYQAKAEGRNCVRKLRPFA